MLVYWIVFTSFKTTSQFPISNKPDTSSSRMQSLIERSYESIMLFVCTFNNEFLIFQFYLWSALYLGSWRHLLVKIFGRRCILKNFRAETYIHIEGIYQISAQLDTWNITGREGQVLAHWPVHLWNIPST